LHFCNKKEEKRRKEKKTGRIGERVVLTAGSEWLPEQSAKRSRGSGWRTAKARHSSLPALLARLVLVLG